MGHVVGTDRAADQSLTCTLAVNPALSAGDLSTTQWAAGWGGGSIALSGGTGAYTNVNVAGLPSGLIGERVKDSEGGGIDPQREPDGSRGLLSREFKALHQEGGDFCVRHSR